MKGFTITAQRGAPWTPCPGGPWEAQGTRATLVEARGLARHLMRSGLYRCVDATRADGSGVRFVYCNARTPDRLQERAFRPARCARA